MATQKAETVQSLSASLKGSSGVYLADYTGITVDKFTVLRRALRKKGARLRVAKNTLIRRAMDDVGFKGLDKHLTGPTALIFADNEDPMAPARVIMDFLKDNEKAVAMKAVHIEGQAYGGEQVAVLAKMPGKRELQASIVSLALGPGSNLLALVKGPGSKLASQIQALTEKLEKGEKVGA